MAGEGRQLPFPGAVDRDGTVTFTLYAPGKRSVHLIGDFNDWNRTADPMREVDQGLWSTTRQLPGGSFAYQFLIDQELVVCDPYARYVEKEPGDRPRKAIVRTRARPYEWHHDRWDRPRFDDLLIYELHIADFTPQRDFRGAVERLAYVRDLGMNAIELMPVFGVHENKGWGYTPTYLFAPNEDYGTPDELRWLIDEAHGHGIAVILDMVLAHTGHAHPFNQMYPYEQSPWYGQGPAGGNDYGLPQLDYAKAPTRAFVKDVLEYWLREFHVDGFRFDYIRSTGVTGDGYGIPTLAWAARSVRPDCYLIGEHLPEAPQLMIDSDMNGAWHARFCHALGALLCRAEHFGYRPDDFEAAIRTLDPAHEGYGQRPTAMVNYIESHDEQRIILRAREAGFDDDTARRKSALGATVLFTAVGPPMLYHGQTVGQDSPKNMDHNYIDWSRLQTPGGRGLYEHYKRLAWLRRQRPALRSPDICLEAILPEQQCVVYRRWDHGGDQVVVLANLSDQSQAISVPKSAVGRWKELFSDQQLELSGDAVLEVDRWAAKVLLGG